MVFGQQAQVEGGVPDADEGVFEAADRRQIVLPFGFTVYRFELP